MTDTTTTDSIGDNLTDESRVSRMGILRSLAVGESYSESYFAAESASTGTAAASLVDTRRKARGNLNSTLRYLKKSIGAEFRTTTMFGMTEDNRLAFTMIIQRVL